MTFSSERLAGVLVNEIGDELLAARQAIAAGDPDQPGILPMPAPPDGGVHAVPLPAPRVAVSFLQVGRLPDLASHARVDDAEMAAFLDVAGQRQQQPLVGPEIDDRIEHDDRIEELTRKRQRPDVRPQREDRILASHRHRACEVGRRVFRAIDSPDSDAELSREEDRADGMAARQIEDAHAGAERQHL